ncbi:hypothetical protein [Aliamphritea spongicola]|nr:hypothetical protein [Aliamphritea spongicola]
MVNKVYLSAQELLEDSFRLAIEVYNSGFRPDFIVGVWRGVHLWASPYRNCWKPWM